VNGSDGDSDSALGAVAAAVGTGDAVAVPSTQVCESTVTARVADPTTELATLIDRAFDGASAAARSKLQPAERSTEPPVFP
jgi:hypothetical protein